MRTKELFLSIFILLYSLSICFAVAQSEDYRLMKCGLYINTKGDIGYKTTELLDEDGNRGVRYLNWIYGADKNDTLNAGLMEMKYVVDTNTFKFLNEVFWSDKNNIYILNPMSDGGTIFILEEIEPKSFKAFANSWYGKDRNNVYFKTFIVENADKKTFRTFREEGFEFYAADKNSYYFYGEKISNEDAKSKGLDKLGRD